MTIINVPANLSFTSVESFKLQRFTNMLRSNFTGQGQKVIYPFAVWMLKAKLRDYAQQDASAIRSFLINLDGQANSFRLPVPGYSVSQSGYTANRLTSVAAAVRATSITVSGGTANAAYLKDGEYFNIADELKIVIGDVNFNSSGIATINFKPPTRAAYAIGTIVDVANPWCLMCAADDDIADWSIKAPSNYGFNFEAIEDF